jgi:hypothetical protein
VTESWSSTAVRRKHRRVGSSGSSISDPVEVAGDVSIVACDQRRASSSRDQRREECCRPAFVRSVTAAAYPREAPAPREDLRAAPAEGQSPPRTPTCPSERSRVRLVGASAPAGARRDREITSPSRRQAGDRSLWKSSNMSNEWLGLACSADARRGAGGPTPLGRVRMSAAKSMRCMRLREPATSRTRDRRRRIEQTPRNRRSSASHCEQVDFPGNPPARRARHGNHSTGLRDQRARLTEPGRGVVAGVWRR